MRREVIVAGIVLAGALPVLATESQHVVPTAYGNTAGTSTFLGPLSNAQRTYQLLVHEDQLTDLVGLSLTGLAWRLPASAIAPWPTVDAIYGDYDIYLSGSVAPADRSFTFADNIVGTQTQVRSGGLSISADTYPFGSSPNLFGPTIEFDQNWLYSGGHLLVDIRHTGFSGTSRSVDALSTSTPGYGTQFSAAWTGNYLGTSGSQGNFSIFQFTAIPAPSAAAVLGLGLVAGLRRRR